MVWNIYTVDNGYKGKTIVRFLYIGSLSFRRCIVMLLCNSLPIKIIIVWSDLHLILSKNYYAKTACFNLRICHDFTEGSSFSLPLHGHKSSTSSYPWPGATPASKAHIDETFTRSTCCFIGKPGFPQKQGFAATTHLSEAKKLCWCLLYACMYVGKYMHKHIYSVYAYNIVQQYLKYIGDKWSMPCMHHVCISFASSSLLWLMSSTNYSIP